MTYAQTYLEKVRTFLKARDHRDSDYYIAQTLGISQGTVHKWKTGQGGVGIQDSYKIALLLEMDTLKVVSELHQDEFKNAETRKVFGEVLALLKDSGRAA